MTLEPGRSPADWGHGHLRASTADRERAIDVLKAAFAEGRLTREEFEERSGQVYRSRTYAELAALTGDLPVGPLGALAWPQPVHPAVPAYPAGLARRPVNSLAVAALVCALIPGAPAAGGVVAGLIARSQIRETGERGDGLARAAIVIGSVTFLAFVLFMLALLSR